MRGQNGVEQKSQTEIVSMTVFVSKDSEDRFCGSLCQRFAVSVRLGLWSRVCLELDPPSSGPVKCLLK